ncbi:AAEL003447-PA [Aedes aegypti]|uniref:AAEL003447-PA n=2 Tax=Aedes aegypti TaxID=7159 RepID=Q17FF7_AEDAE|nr:AAEL003447-PA [Aedes aegypti]
MGSIHFSNETVFHQQNSETFKNMIRPELVQQLACPSFGLATSWIISRQGKPAGSLEQVWREFRRETWPFPKTKAGKDGEKARKLREKANDLYRGNPTEMDRVLRAYNEGICWAVEGSEEAAMGYGNRSAVYLKMGKYARCLANVELAKASGYPDAKMEKLEERKRKCLEVLEGKTDEVGGEVFDELDSKKELRVGEVAVVERPLLVVVEPEAVQSRCNYCGSKNELDLIPCRKCVSVMYCSEKCRDEAYSCYHKFECAVIKDLKNLFRGPKPTRMFQLTLKLFWMALNDLINDQEGFLKKYQEGLKSFRDPLEMDLSKQLHMHVLANDEPDTSSDLTGKGVTQFLTVLIYKIAVEENESVPTQVLKDNNSLLLEIMQKLVLMAKQICDQSVDDLTCFYPLLQMINHSCAPNAERIVSGDLRSIILTKRPINAGEQILICYFPNGSTDYKDKTKRKEMLQKEFQFECQCLGCSLDYPLLSTIEENAELRGQLEDIKTKSGDDRLKLLEDFLQQNDDQFPLKELAEAWNLYKQEILKRF